MIQAFEAEPGLPSTRSIPGPSAFSSMNIPMLLATSLNIDSPFCIRK